MTATIGLTITCLDPNTHENIMVEKEYLLVQEKDGSNSLVHRTLTCPTCGKMVVVREYLGQTPVRTVKLD